MSIFYARAFGPVVFLLAVLSSAPAQSQAPAQVLVVARINAGGPATSAGGVDWMEDTYFEEGRPSLASPETEISGTNDDTVYRTGRTSTGRRQRFFYRIPVPTPGLYMVRLHMAEIYWGVEGGEPGGVGSRVFDVDAEGETVIDDLDMIAEAGPAATIVREFSILVADGVLDLGWVATVDQPFVNAIEVTGQEVTTSQVAQPSGVVVGTPTPNPAASRTTLALDVARASTVDVSLYDLLGRRVRVLSTSVAAGSGQAVLNLEGVAPGVYAYRVRVADGEGTMASSGMLTVIR